MPRIIRTLEDAENAFRILEQHKKTLGYVPLDVLQSVREAVRYGRENARLRFYKRLADNPELLREFHRGQN